MTSARLSNAAVGLTAVSGSFVVAGAWLRLTLLALGCALAVTSMSRDQVCSVVSIPLAFGVLLLPPTAIGEMSALLGTALVGASGLYLFLNSQGGKVRFEERKNGVILTLGLVSLATYWGFLASTSREYLNTFLVCCVTLLVVTRLHRHREVVLDSLRLISLAVSLIGLMWLPAVAIGGRALEGSVPVTRLDGGVWRPNFSYVAWHDLVIANSPGLFGSLRVSGLGGEPGAWGCLGVLSGIAAVLLFTGNFRRIVIVGSSACVISAQSTGVWLGIGGALVLAVIYLAVRRGVAPHVLAVGLGTAVAGALLVERLISYKAITNSASITDRGLASGIASAGAGRINMLTGLATDGILGLLPIVSALTMVWVARRSSWGLVTAVFILVYALFAQPYIYQFGAVITASMLVWMAAVSHSDPPRLERNSLEQVH